MLKKTIQEMKNLCRFATVAHLEANRTKKSIDEIY